MELKQTLQDHLVFAKLTNTSLTMTNLHAENVHNSPLQILITLTLSAIQDTRKMVGTVLTLVHKGLFLMLLAIASVLVDIILKEMFAKNQLHAHQDQHGMLLL